MSWRDLPTPRPVGPFINLRRAALELWIRGRKSLFNDPEPESLVSRRAEALAWLEARREPHKVEILKTDIAPDPSMMTDEEYWQWFDSEYDVIG